MPIEYTVEPDRKIATVNVHHTVGARDIIQAIQQVARDPAFHPHFTVVVNAAEMDYHPALPEISGLISVLSDYKNRFRGKIAVLTDPQNGFVARIGCLFAETRGLNIKAFDSRCEAEAWLQEQIPL